MWILEEEKQLLFFATERNSMKHFEITRNCTNNSIFIPCEDPEIKISPFCILLLLKDYF